LKSQRTQTGVALVMVLWILLLVTISSGAYTDGRMDQLKPHRYMGTRARLIAKRSEPGGIVAATKMTRDGRRMAALRWYEDATIESSDMSRQVINS
jgi:type II secretory pathway component PulK